MRLNQEKEVVEMRLHNLEQDLAVLESKKERLAQEEAELVLKLVATREQILSAQEQDE
jgi:predicted  nucleic acid-binding Zn-ribbon protein